MNREQITNLAREAGLFVPHSGIPEGGALMRFAAAIAECEREACAKLVEPSEEHRRDASWGYIGGTEGVNLLDNVAAAIRARSNT